MSELKITKEKVLEAAAKCSTAKETLKTLFPEAFDDQKYFNLNSLVLDGFNEILITKEKCKKIDFLNKQGTPLLQVRMHGKYSYKGFYLDDEVNWEILTDHYGYKVLVPTKK